MNIHDEVAIRDSLRQKGKSAFIWRYGILRGGVPAAIMIAVMFYGAERGFYVENFISIKFAVTLILFLFFIGLGLGYAFGDIFWRLAEENRRRKSQRDEQNLSRRR